MNYSQTRTLILCGAFLLCSLSAHAREWQRHCVADRCAISVRFPAGDEADRLLRIQVFADPSPIALFTFPLGTWLREGWSWHVDGNPPKRETIDVCVPEGCLIGIRLTPEHIRQFEQGRWLHVNFRDSKLQPVEVKVSLIGFTAAYASLAAE